MTTSQPLHPLPPLRDVIAKYRLGAVKSLGQHFLLDLNLTDRIARAPGDLSRVTVLEIGPGPGGLTRSLLNAGAQRVLAIERDDRFLPALEELARAYPNRLTIVHADALKISEPTVLPPPANAKVVANLPYNVATPLLVKWLRTTPWPPWYDSLTLMFQKEVADRIKAQPGTKVYGRLSILAQWRCDVKSLLDVPARAFTPPPKVDSSVIHITPLTENYPRDELLPVLEKITKAAFGQRRKMLRASLRSLVDDAESFLHDAGIDPKKRAEQLTVAEFVGLSEALLARE